MAEQRKSYWEKLRDPRWQRKRLEIQNRDEWTCQDCGENSKTLNVHHTYYERGKDPWDYPDWSLMTLCEACHERRGELKLALDKATGGLPLGSLEEVIGYCCGIEMSEFPVVRVAVWSISVLEGLAKAWDMTVMEIDRLLSPGSQEIDGLTLSDYRVARLRAKTEPEFFI